MSTAVSQPAPATKTATATVMIVEDTPFWQKQIEQAIQGAGFTTVLANNGVEALALLENVKPNLIVSDVEMPQMTGLELMKALRAQPLWQKLPIILLTTGAAKERILEATRLKAAEYMLKGAFSAEQLVERVKKWLSPKKSAPPAASAAPKPVASAFPRLLQKAQVLPAIAAQVAGGKTISSVLTQMTEQCNAAAGNALGCLEIIKHDPILAMRVMQQANTIKRVGTVEDALRTLNVESVRTITQSLTAYPKTSASVIATWQHAIAVASVMHKIVPRSFEMGIGVAYVIGLLHDLPEILFRQIYPAQYEAAIDFAGQANKSLRHIMPEVFGTTISEIANELATQLKLPPLIATPLREYAAATEMIGHTNGPSAPIVDRLAMALRFAEYYVNAMRLTPTPADAFIAPLSLNECRAAYVATDAIDGDAVRDQSVAAVAKLLGETKDAATITGRPRIWYARHNTYAALDPVEQALRQIADVQVHAEPPNKREHFTDLKAVVVVAPTLDTYGLLWCVPDRINQGPNPPKVLYILPSASHTDPKSAGNEHIQILQQPFSLERFNEVFKSL